MSETYFQKMGLNAIEIAQTVRRSQESVCVVVVVVFTGESGGKSNT